MHLPVLVNLEHQPPELILIQNLSFHLKMMNFTLKMETFMQPPNNLSETPPEIKSSRGGEYCGLCTHSGAIGVEPVEEDLDGAPYVA